MTMEFKFQVMVKRTGIAYLQVWLTRVLMVFSGGRGSVIYCTHKDLGMLAGTKGPLFML